MSLRLVQNLVLIGSELKVVIVQNLHTGLFDQLERSKTQKITDILPHLLQWKGSTLVLLPKGWSLPPTVYHLVIGGRGV